MKATMAWWERSWRQVFLDAHVLCELTSWSSICSTILSKFTPGFGPRRSLEPRDATTSLKASSTVHFRSRFPLRMSCSFSLSLKEICMSVNRMCTYRRSQESWVDWVGMCGETLGSVDQGDKTARKKYNSWRSEAFTDWLALETSANDSSRRSIISLNVFDDPINSKAHR